MSYDDESITSWRGRDGRFHTRGDNARTSVLTVEEVKAIKATPRKVTHAEIAAELGVSRTQVAHIRQGRQWSHVKVEAR